MLESRRVSLALVSAVVLTSAWSTSLSGQELPEPPRGWTGFTVRFNPGIPLLPALDGSGNVVFDGDGNVVWDRGAERPRPTIGAVWVCSPADEAGLRTGDVIVLVNGQDARGSPARVWGKLQPGAIREFRIRRDGELFDISLTAISYDDWNPGCERGASWTISEVRREAPGPGGGFRGFSFNPFGGPVTPRRDENGNLTVVPPASERGYPVIFEVYPCSPADDAGLRAGDALILVNGQDARDTSSMWHESRPGMVQDLRIRRGEESFDVSLTEISYYEWDSECGTEPAGR